MPKISIICGIILILIGLAGYVIGMMNDNRSVTALIPAVFGFLLLGFGVGAQRQESMRKHLMHAAAAIALLGFIATGGRVLSTLGKLTMSPAVISQIATAVVCLVFLILAIRSFMAARRERINA